MKTVTMDRFQTRYELVKSYCLMGFMGFSLVLLATLNPVVAGSYEKGSSKASMDIVETAVSAGQFNTLAKALEAGDLVATLKGKGPFTVFAPTDAAFAKLPEGTLDSLLKDKAKLQSILTYHVVPGKVMAADVVSLSEAKTVNGQSFKIKKSDAGVMVDNAKVVKTDIVASNGVIHVIDTVILPK